MSEKKMIFQFHKVRLKEGKQLHDHFIPYEFQFHKVRLKAVLFIN